MRQILSFLLCLCTAFTLSAQTYSGKVTDEKNRPLPYANVVLLSLPDSAFVTGTVSDESGAFTLRGEKPKLLLRVSSIGYATIYNKVEKQDLGTIQLLPDAQLLGEVVVKGDLPKVQLKGDAQVTNVTGTILEKAGTGNDLLSKLPGVSAEEGTVNVFGSGTAEIYINGRKMRNASELDQLSSDNVKRVEVVRNPGARYDATVKAVVRIYTKKAQGEGFGFNNRFLTRYQYDWSVLDQFNYFNARYTHQSDAIVQGCEAYSEDQPTISLLVPANKYDLDQFHVTLSFSPTIGIWTPQLTLMLLQQWYKVDTPDGLKNFNNPVGNFVWNNNFRLPWGVLLDADVWFITPGDDEVGHQKESSWCADVSLRKSFWSERLSLQLQGSNLFNSSSALSTVFSGSRTMTFDQETRRRFMLTLRYKFNTTKSKYKGTGAGQEQRSRM